MQLVGPCRLWTGTLDSDGYGRASAGRLAHRVTYELEVGPIPPGLEIDHLCRNRACVNPDHMEIVTHAINMARSSTATKTECINGHPYDEANTYIRPSGHRDCRRCSAERQRRYERKRRAG